MTELFLKMINMSFSASWLILAVVVIRLIFRESPKWIRMLLWGLVAVRLIVPFSVESMFSLIPSAEVISRENLSESEITIQTGVKSIDTQVNEYLGEHYHEDVDASESSAELMETITMGESVGSASMTQGGDSEIILPVTSKETTELQGPIMPAMEGSNADGLLTIFAGVWLVGILLLIAYSFISYSWLYSRVRTAVRLREHIFQSENVTFPFVFGLIAPKIYLPFGLEESTYDCVIAHEQAHIKRLDYIWKPMGFLLLAIYWFNPLMWLAYVLLCRDIELACDEKVIKELNKEQIAEYAQALLVCSVNNSRITACPVAFSEIGVKDRVKAMAKYEKPAFWMIIVSVVLCVIVGVCFLTNPKTESRQKENDSLSENSGDEAEVVQGEQQSDTDLAEEGNSGSVTTGADGVDSNGGSTVPVTENDGNGVEIEERPTYTLPMEFGSADLDGDGQEETFRVSEVTFDRYQLDVLKADGSVLWGEECSTAHAGWNSFFLCRLDGKDYLLRYNPTMYQGLATYYYELCRIENGALTVVEKDSVDFSSNPGAVLTSEQRADMKTFAKRVNELLSTSIVLLSTEEGMLEYGGGSADSYKEYYEALGDVGAMLMEQSDASDTLNVSISGYFVATVRDILPDYLGDDFTPAVAVVQMFQDNMFTLPVGDLAEQLEIGKTYVFETEVKDNIEVSGIEYKEGPLAPEKVVPYYNIRIKAVREAEEGEGGLDSSHLFYKLEE